MTRQAGAIVIGAGHNGLVCACYLARAGLAVTLIETQENVGGAAATEEFHPGFRNSIASYTVSLLHPRIIEDLHLHQHGLRIVNRPINNYLPMPGGDGLLLYPDLSRTREEFARHDHADANRLPDYYRMLDSVVPFFRAMMLKTPPRLANGGVGDVIEGLRLAAELGGLSIEHKRVLHNLLTRSAGELLDQWFNSPIIKGLFGFDSVVGNYASPYGAGSAYVLVHHLLGEANGVAGAWGHAMGGMGSITRAMRAEAEALGVTVVCGQRAEQINVLRDKVQGLTLAGGQVLDAPLVVSAINPRPTYLDLIDPSHLDESLLEQVRLYACGSASLRINLALDELPRFNSGRSLPAEVLQSGIIMAPGLDYMDRAYLDARRHGWSRDPIIEMLIPSTLDDSLAPEGKHVASLFCQYFDPDPGDDWDQIKDEVVDRIIDVVTEYAPNVKGNVIARQVFSPLDIERRFGMIRGDIFHGRLSLDQLYSARPVLGYGDYRTPIRGLYLCGSGTHPGGGVSGLPGHNAAREILRDKSKWRTLFGVQ